MIKVLIADDELPIREWLKFTLAKVQRSIEIVGVVSNGKEALDLYYETQPDLVITDIKMPVMDGLELVKIIRNSQSNTYLAMLTSHSDFEYARNALAYGANEYILKNEIDAQILERVIDSCIQRAEKFSSQNTTSQTDYLCDLMQMQDNRIIDVFEKGGIHLPLQSVYFVVAAAFFPREIQDLSIMHSGQYTDSGHNIQYSVFDYDDQIKVWVVSLAGISSSFNQLNILHSFYSSVQKAYVKNFSTSGITDRNHNLQETIQRTVTLLNRSFYSTDTSLPDKMNDTITDTGALESAKDLFYTAMVNIANKDFTQAEDSTEKLLAYIAKEKISDVVQVKNYFSNIVNAYHIISLGTDLPNFEEICQETEKRIMNVSNYYLLESAVKAFFASVNSLSINRHARYSSYVKGAIAIVQKDYSTIKKITDVTDQLNINMEYFCRLFKNDVGKTFNDYLTDYRLSVAENLIKSTDLSLLEVSEKVGYYNFAYFSRLYKKRRGVNLNQIRKRENPLPG